MENFIYKLQLVLQGPFESGFVSFWVSPSLSYFSIILVQIPSSVTKLFEKQTTDQIYFSSKKLCLGTVNESENLPCIGSEVSI